jgi:hypothetical protein
VIRRVLLAVLLAVSMGLSGVSACSDSPGDPCGASVGQPCSRDSDCCSDRCVPAPIPPHSKYCVSRDYGPNW